MQAAVVVRRTTSECAISSLSRGEFCFALRSQAGGRLYSIVRVAAHTFRNPEGSGPIFSIMQLDDQFSNTNRFGWRAGDSDYYTANCVVIRRRILHRRYKCRSPSSAGVLAPTPTLPVLWVHNDGLRHFHETNQTAALSRQMEGYQSS